MSLLTEAVVHRGLAHQVKQNNKYDTGALSRTARVFAADRTEYSYSSNPMISIKLPASSHFDMAYSSLNFLIQFDAGELLGGAHNLFRRVLIRGSDGRIWCETENIDVLNSALMDFTMNQDQRNTSFAITSGTGDSARRTALGKNSGSFCSLQPLLQLCRYERYLPLNLIGSCTIELYLQDPRVCFKHTGDVAYKITSVSYRCDLVEFNSEVESLLMTAWAQNKLRFHFKNWRSTQFTSGAQNALITISNPDQSVNALLVVPRKASVTTSQNADSYERVFGDLEEISVSAGNNIIERISARNGASQVFFELQKMLDMSENISITPAEWVSTKFSFGVNLEIVNGNEDALAGYSGRGDIKIEFFRSSQPSEPIVYTCFILHDQILLASQEQGTSILW